MCADLGEGGKSQTDMQSDKSTAALGQGQGSFPS